MHVLLVWDFSNPLFCNTRGPAALVRRTECPALPVRNVVASAGVFHCLQWGYHLCLCKWHLYTSWNLRSVLQCHGFGIGFPVVPVRLLRIVRRCNNLLAVMFRQNNEEHAPIARG